MFESVTTNVAAILTIILIWSSLVGIAVFLYMDNKLAKKDDIIRFLDDYIHDFHREMGDFR